MKQLCLLLLFAKALLGDSPKILSHPSLLKDAKGNMAAFWLVTEANQTSLTSAIYFPGAGWGTPVSLSNPDSSIISMPQIAMNSLGEIVAVWKSYSNSMEKVIFEAAFSSTTDGEWTTPTMISDANGSLQDVKVSIDEQSNVAAIWCCQSDERPGEFAINVTVAQHKGAWSPPLSLPN